MCHTACHIHMRGVAVNMRYSRVHVKQALNAAREDGRPVDFLRVGDRETELTLERMGYLPVDQAAIDQKVQDWYVAQGLALRGDTPIDTPADTPEPVPEGVPERSGGADGAALDAAEAALQAASAAIRLARQLSAS